jgi:ABC-type bacteriocin/lantibiotic exporter with double-glycine peptidase domain
MFIYNWLLTLIALGLSIIPIVITIILGNYMAKTEKKVSDQNETYTATIKDTLSGFSVIKAFKVEAEMIKNFKSFVQLLEPLENCR